MADIQRGYLVERAGLCSRFVSYLIGVRAYLSECWGNNKYMFKQKHTTVISEHSNNRRLGTFSLFSKTEFFLTHNRWIKIWYAIDRPSGFLYPKWFDSCVKSPECK